MKKPVSAYADKADEVIDIVNSAHTSSQRTFQVAGKLREIAGEPALPFHEACNLASVLGCVQGNTKVGRMVDGRIYIGEARCFVSDEQCNLRPDDDVRDLYLRVTLDAGGVDTYWLVSDLMVDYAAGYFVTHYEVPAVL